MILRYFQESDITVSSMVGDSDSSRLTIGSRMSEDSLNIDSGNGSEPPENSGKNLIIIYTDLRMTKGVCIPFWS